MKNSKKDASSSSFITETEKSERKTVLNLFIAQYLSKCGFVKSLAKFRSEAKLDEFDSSKEYLSTMEEELLKCLEKINQAHGHSNGDKDQEHQINGISRKDGESDCVSSLETDFKKKKTKSKSDKNGTIAAENESEAIKKVTSPEIPNDIVTSDLVPEPIVKSKTKKKKMVNGSEDAIQVSSDVLTSANGNANEPLVDKSSKKNKEKKKSKSGCESIAENANDNETEAHVTDVKKKKEKIVGSKCKKIKDDLALKSFPEKEIEMEERTNAEIKESKKRKRMSSEVQKSETANEISNEESKRRKTGSMEESQPKKHLTEVNAVFGSDGVAGKESKKGDGKVSFNNSQDISVKQKSLKKQNGGSVELQPKSANAFQRVKIDKVVFTDERLQDNSYWAKGGAEIGYGAKAQEVLGQVRGRDFRHEKTKKKRGSYRGGQIDFTSHSVKFNYSDDE